MQDKNLNILRRKRAFEVKSKTFFIIFKGLSVAKNCLRPESAPLIAGFCNSVANCSLTLTPDLVSLSKPKFLNTFTLFCKFSTNTIDKSRLF